MRLIDDAGRVLRKAWSIRWNAGAFLFAILEAAVPFFYDAWPPRIAASIAALMAAVGFATRFIAQPEIHRGNS
jgi:hypothetical protein